MIGAVFHQSHQVSKLQRLNTVTLVVTWQQYRRNVIDSLGG